MTAARQGCRDSLGQLLQALQPDLLALARHSLPPNLQAKVGASDLVQETLIDAFCSFPQFIGETLVELRYWLKRILQHNLSDSARRFCSARRRQVAREWSLDQGWGPERAAALGDSRDNPVDLALRKEELQVLERTMAQLPPEDQEMIRLHYRIGLTHSAVARLLGCNEATVRQRWSRAIERWRQAVLAVYRYN